MKKKTGSKSSSFFFVSEVCVVSNELCKAYGAHLKSFGFSSLASTLLFCQVFCDQ